MTQRPYLGLRPFDYPDQRFFFGRQEQIYALYRLIDRSRFVSVVGSSGSGKSSLVRAGLLPLLDEESREAGCRVWKRKVMRPGTAPIATLAKELAALTTDDEPALSNVRRERLAFDLRRSSFGLAEALSKIPELEDAAFLLVVDQFEELFRYAAQETSTADGAECALSRDEAAHFVQLLIEGARAATCEVHVVITMRSDFIGDCARFHGLPESVSGAQFLVPGLTRDQLEEAITKPLDVVGATIEPALVERLLNDCNDDRDQLPVLQHCMLRLWEASAPKTIEPVAEAKDGAASDQRRLSMHHYTEIGELGGALSQHAEKILEGLPGLELAVEQTFRALSETDREGRAVRRAMPFSQLRAETGVPEAELREVLDRFRRDDCSFLTTSPPDAPAIAPDTQIDVGHEALLWRWARMNGGASTPGAAKGQADQGWLADEEDDGLIYRGLLTLLDQAGGETPTLPLRQVEGRWRWWTSRPRTAAWAARYGGKFPEVQRLFDASRRALDAERIRGERERFVRRASTAGFVFGFLLICSALGVAWRQNLQKDEAYRALSASESRFKVSSHAYRAQSDALRGGVVSALTRTASAAKHYEVLERASIAKDVSLTMRQTFVLTFRSAAEVGGILFRKDGMIRAVAFHPSEPLVAYGGTGGQIMVSGTNGAFLHSIPACEEGDNLHNLYSLAFSPDGSLLAAGCEDGTVAVWNSGDWRLRSRWKAHAGRTWVVRFNRDGTYLASGGQDNKIMVMRLTGDGFSEKELIELSPLPPTKGPDGQIWSLATSPTEDKLVAGDGNRNLWLCDIGNDKNPCAPVDVRDLPDGKGDDATLAIAFSRDGKSIATGHTSGAVWLWNEELDRKSRKKIVQLPAFINSIAFIDRNGKISLAFGTDKLWEISLANETYEPKHLTIAGDEVYALSFHSPTGLLAAATRGGYVALVSTRDREERLISRLPLGTDSFESCPQPADAPHLWVDRRRGAVIDDSDGKTRLVVAQCEQLVLVGVERDSHKEIKSHVLQTLSTEQVRQGQVQRVVASAAKWRVATLGEDGSVKFWRLGVGDMLIEEPDLALNTEYFKAKGFGAVRAERVLLSPDGDWLICSFTGGGSLLRIDLRDGARREKVYQTPLDKINELAFSAEGRLFAAGGASKNENSKTERRVVLWDFDAGNLKPRDSGSKFVPAVRELALVSDRDKGPLVAVAANDGQMLVWKANTPNAESRCQADCRELRTGSNTIVQFAFSPAEALLAAADTMGRITLWDTGSWEVVELAPLPEQAKAKVGLFGFQKNGAFLLSGAKDLNVWDLDISLLRGKACDILGAGNAGANQRLSQDASEACE